MAEPPDSPAPGLELWAGEDSTFLYEMSLRLTPAQIGHALRVGACPLDRAFDRYLPDDLRMISNQYWTPLVVALRVAGWLEEHGVRSVVDIGSGAGKLCVAAALACSASFVGLEQRPRLVASARALAELFEVEDRVRFSEGALGHVEVPRADAYYLFNPFGENIFGVEESIDQAVELSEARYDRDITAVEDLLLEAPIGTYVLTYNGFGGHVPRDYRELRADLELPSVLRMWQKTDAPRPRRQASATEATAA